VARLKPLRFANRFVTGTTFCCDAPTLVTSGAATRRSGWRQINVNQLIRSLHVKTCDWLRAGYLYKGHRIMFNSHTSVCLLSELPWAGPSGALSLPDIEHGYSLLCARLGSGACWDAVGQNLNFCILRCLVGLLTGKRRAVLR
jgi:hypothetical protein